MSKGRSVPRHFRVLIQRKVQARLAESEESQSDFANVAKRYMPTGTMTQGAVHKLTKADAGDVVVGAAARALGLGTDEGDWWDELERMGIPPSFSIDEDVPAGAFMDWLGRFMTVRETAWRNERIYLGDLVRMFLVKTGRARSPHLAKGDALIPKGDVWKLVQKLRRDPPVIEETDEPSEPNE